MVAGRTLGTAQRNCGSETQDQLLDAHREPHWQTEAIMALGAILWNSADSDTVPPHSVAALQQRPRSGTALSSTLVSVAAVCLPLVLTLAARLYTCATVCMAQHLHAHSIRSLPQLNLRCAQLPVISTATGTGSGSARRVQSTSIDQVILKKCTLVFKKNSCAQLQLDRW